MVPSPSLPEPVTRREVLRALIKGVYLFLIAIVLYALAHPGRSGTFPTVYNHLVPGRTRLMRDYEQDPYRLIDDHVISQATTDTFNVVFLGSSEIWGNRTTADDSIPAIMDRVGLVAADGRPVRVYNLGFPYPYAFKDLVVLETLFRRNIPVDLVIVSTFDASFSWYYVDHPIVISNLALTREIAMHYNLPSSYLNSISADDESAPVVVFWYERNSLLRWMGMQMRGIRRGLLVNHDDLDAGWSTLPEPVPALTDFFDSQPGTNIDPQADVLFAFAQLSQERGLPVIILAPPAPVKKDVFTPWLREQTTDAGLPLLDCSTIYPEPSMFEDYYHITPAMHDNYAHVLAQHLTEIRLPTQTDMMPLQWPSGLEKPDEECVFYPVVSQK